MTKCKWERITWWGDTAVEHKLRLSWITITVYRRDHTYYARYQPSITHEDKLSAKTLKAAKTEASMRLWSRLKEALAALPQEESDATT